MAKVTLAVFKVYIENQRTGSDNDARLQAALDAADRGIDIHCGRNIAVAGAASERVFRPGSPTSRYLAIDDCTTITSVAEDGSTLTANTDYVADPLNQLSQWGETWPTEGLFRVDRYWYWNDVRTTVSINATWGWTAIPTPVVEACKMLAKDIAASREFRGDVAGFGEFGAVRIRQSPQLLAMLDDYVRPERAFGLA